MQTISSITQKKTNNQMKKIILVSLMILGTLIHGLAQSVNLTCENSSGLSSTTNNRNFDIANCWGFGGVVYAESVSRIDGRYSTQSGVASNLNPTSFWIKSPWLKPGTGNITLKTKLSATSSNARYLTLAYVPYNAAGTGAKEGTRVDFYTYTFSTNSNNVITISAPIPAAIENSNQAFKIMALFYGNGGSTRIITDTWDIPGTYWANPSNGCLPQALIVDADTDGVADADDAYPNDATRAYNNLYPAPSFGTLMFEDLWPTTGDYDFNDLVVDYRYNLVTNAANKVVEMKGTFVTRAIGASFRNGFAFQLNNLSPNKITAVTGAKYHGAPWISNASNGTENGQTFANVIVFDEAQKVLPSPGGSGTNIMPANPKVAPDTTFITITFTAVSGQMIGLSDVVFNPYIIINQIRGKELHLPNNVPSGKVDASFFGQNQDNSIPAQGKYYKTSNNLPWALNINTSIPYAHSTNDFVTAYLKFAEWAQSNGTLYTDWYINNSGYRDASKLFVP
jgi:LruC domain-containing protein